MTDNEEEVKDVKKRRVFPSERTVRTGGNALLFIYAAMFITCTHFAHLSKPSFFYFFNVDVMRMCFCRHL